MYQERDGKLSKNARILSTSSLLEKINEHVRNSELNAQTSYLMAMDALKTAQNIKLALPK